jgi:hypothetical protein
MLCYLLQTVRQSWWIVLKKVKKSIDELPKSILSLSELHVT